MYLCDGSSNTVTFLLQTIFFPLGQEEMSMQS